MKAPSPPVEELCRIAHDAYQVAAEVNVWQMLDTRRTSWDDMPETHKATMRAAMDAVWTHVCNKVIAAIRAENTALRERVNIEHAALQECMEHELQRAAERDTAQAKVSAVERLADEFHGYDRIVAGSIRAALGQPATEASR